ARSTTAPGVPASKSAHGSEATDRRTRQSAARRVPANHGPRYSDSHDSAPRSSDDTATATVPANATGPMEPGSNDCMMETGQELPGTIYGSRTLKKGTEGFN